MENSLQFEISLQSFDRSEICTELSFTLPEVMWTQIMKLPYIKVKFYPKVKSQTGLSSLRVSCKRTHRFSFTLVLHHCPSRLVRRIKFVFCEKFLCFLLKILLFIRDTFMSENSDLLGYCAKKIILLSNVILLLKHFKYLRASNFFC